MRLSASNRIASAVALLVLASGNAAADIPIDFAADINCAVRKSFVLCSVPVKATPGARITHAEANVIKEPSFLRAVATKSTFTEEKSMRPNLRLGFEVKGEGTGEIVVQAHGNVCPDLGGHCRHFSKIVIASLTVGR